MASEDVINHDIFQGAEKVEILGKLPFILREYIGQGRKFLEDMGKSPFDLAGSIRNMYRIIDLLGSAADHLGNPDLKGRLGGHSQMLHALSKGEMSQDAFRDSFNSGLAQLEQMAGPRPKMAGDGILTKGILEKELNKAERIKAGRSADIIVSEGLLREIKESLAKETTTEGISAVLVIDNAGSLIAHVGGKIDLDAVSLAAVAAANFAATERIARLIGEREFVLLFYKGRNESFHFCRVGKDYIMVTIFSNSLSLGLLRLRLTEVAQMLEKKLPKGED